MAHDEWMTPQWVISAVMEAAGVSLIGLDPCSTAEANEVVKAAKYYTKEQNGLAQDWWIHGFAWCNPPYSDPRPWVEKMAANPAKGGPQMGALLMNTATETKAGQMLLNWARYVWFPNKRIQFVAPTDLRDVYKSNSNRSGQMIGFFGVGNLNTVKLRKHGVVVEEVDWAFSG